MTPDKNKSIGFGLRGHNIEMPSKINVKSIVSKQKKSVSEEYDYYSPLNIEPKELNIMPSVVDNHIRFRYSSRKNFE